MAMTDAASFQVIILTAASHYAADHRDHRLALRQLKYEAICFINGALRDERRFLSDQVIGAVAKMASFEAMYGDKQLYHMHMMGLQRMVALRGGLAWLGLDGLLARILLWIDLNAAFLIGSRMYFVQDVCLSDFFNAYCAPSPNPGHFLGAS